MDLMDVSVKSKVWLVDFLAQGLKFYMCVNLLGNKFYEISESE